MSAESWETIYSQYQKEISDAFDEDGVDIFLLGELEHLYNKFPQINEIYLFGSRRYPDQSTRSDIDLLLVKSSYVKPADIRSFISGFPALDLFLVTGASAVSCANESSIESDTFDALILKLDAVKVWSRDTGHIDVPGVKPFFKLREDVEFVMSVMPRAFFTPESYDGKMKLIESSGLPVSPMIGEDVDRAAEFLADVAERMVFKKDHFATAKSQARGSWITRLSCEYDFQDLFEIVCRPFIPNLSREEVAIVYDDKRKFSDFSFFDSQIIVEMKHVTSNQKSSEVVKTLAGLKDFYKRHANVKVLLFIVYVDATVDLDDRKWMADFSFLTTTPKVITKVIRNG